jgi:pimeloyl-ACP methyl ester carboxylesterase
VGGSPNALAPHVHSEYLARAIPGARLVAVEQNGHGPHREKPEQFLRAVGDFLEGAREA